MTAVDALPAVDGEAADLARALVTWLETGERPSGLFAEDLFADLSLPQWRVQAEGPEAAFRLRQADHPFPGEVRVESLDRTSRGFLLQFEERWDHAGQRWYARELIHCAVADGLVSELTIFCTGDWDEAAQRRHAEQVQLIRS